MGMKIGVLGAGHLGNIHLKLLAELQEWDVVGFHDPDIEKSKAASETYGIASYSSVDELVSECDALDIVTPTLSHFECAKLALANNKHVFIEKPITNTPEEALELVKMAADSGRVVQVGHVERFNPAFTSVREHCSQPMFIEAHRLAEFNPRGTDVSVVLDLMIHDIDIILSLISS
ncbi:MAG: Gfo/Idh/MocA family oxidoreductase, partial [Flavobacteriales bacterium]|nr:Gfo/Idh/MocA family oxidoreductase [Flavobacteriales bacterium]